MMIFLTLSLLLSMRVDYPATQDTSAPETKAKLEIEELEKRWLAAGDDADVLQVVLAQDCVLVFPTGIISKEARIAQVKKQRGTPTHESLRFNDLQIRIYGVTAIANGTLAATDIKTNAVKKFLFTDVFSYRDGRWQVINTQRTAIP